MGSPLKADPASWMVASSQKDTALCAQREPSGTFIAIWPRGSRHRRHCVVGVFPSVLAEDARTPPERVRFVLSVRGEATLANNKHQHGSRAEAPGPLLPPPTEARVTTRGGGAQTGGWLARGFPKRWRRDLQASARGPPQQPEEKGACHVLVTPRLRAFLHNGVLVN